MGEERRDLSREQAELALHPVDSTAPEAGRFVGYAARFDSPAMIGQLAWGFVERIAPGAFTTTLREGDQRFLIDHDPYYVVARVSATTLTLTQDQRGLVVDAALDPELSYVRDLKANLRNGNLTGMSFGFTVPDGGDEWSQTELTDAEGRTHRVPARTIHDVALIEVSAVTFPAYPDTTAGLRHSLVPALRGRGQPEVIARAVLARPDLAPLLGYDPAATPTVLDLKPSADEPDTRFAPPDFVLAKARLRALRTRLRHRAR